MAQAFNLTAQLNLRGPSNVKQIVSDIRKQIGTIEGEVKFKIDATSIGNTAKLNQSLQALNKNLSLVSTNASAASIAIKNFGQSVSSVGNTSSKLSSSVSKAAKSTDNLGVSSSKSAKNITIARTEMEEFGRQSALAVRRFAAFSAVTGIFFGLSRAINSGLKSFIEFDRQLVKLQQVTGKNAEGLRGLQDEITRLAVGLGVSSDSLIDVSSTLAQAGLSASDTKVALEALARSSLAPSFDDMNQTVEGSIALMKQFGISAKDLEKALGSVNSVAAAFAVESSDIISAIQRTGGVFANASRGVSEGTDALNEFIAVFTSVRATTRESAETIATGLRTIFTRIQRQGTIEALREFGVTLTDAEGKFVGAYKAVQLLSEGLGRIDPRDLRFSQIVEELGGFRQIGKVIPLIQQFATAQEALKVAQAGQGSLASDAVKAQLSLANQISKVREEFLTLIRSLGQSDTFQTLARGALTFASGLIKITDALKGVLPALAILGAGAGLRGVAQFTGGFIGGLKKVKTGPGEENQSVAGAIGSNLASSLVGAKTEQVSRDLDQNSSSLDKVSDRLDTLVSSLNNLDANFSTINSILNTNNTLLQQSIASLGSNTSSLDNLTNAINNLNLGGGPATIKNGGRILGFAKGGSVPGSGKGDKVPALLEPGEVVMSNSAVNKYGRGNLVRMNKFAQGNLVKEQLQNLKSDTIKSYFNKNINPKDIAESNIKQVPIDLNTSDFKKMALIMKDTEIKRLGDIKKFGNKRIFSMKSPGGYWPAGNAFQQLLINEGIVKGVKVPTNFGTSQEELSDIEAEHYAPLDYTTGDAKFVNNISDINIKKILAKRFKYNYTQNRLRPKPTPDIDTFTLPQTSIYYPDNGLKEKFNDWLAKNASEWSGEALIEYEQSNKGYFGIGGKIQKFMAGGVAEATDAMTLDIAKTKSREEIMKILSRRTDGISTTERAVGVGPGEIYRILGKRNPDPSTGALKEAILKEYVKTYNRQAGAAQGQITRLTNQGLVVAAAGMFGNKFADTTETIESPLLSSSPQVRIISGVMGAKTAASLESVFASPVIEELTDKGAETLLISDILEKFGLGRELNLDFDRTLAIGADNILSDPGSPVFSEFSDRTKVGEALKKARLTALGEALVSSIKDRPELLASTKIVTARPDSTLDLVQDWLSSQGLPIPRSQMQGFGGAGVKADDIAKLKAAFLSPGSLFVDDDPRNISAASARKDVTSYQYGIGKSLPNSQAEGGIQGLLLEQVIQKLDGPGAQKGFGFDFPKGLGPAAKYFDLPDDIPTDVKRTISGPSTITDNIVTWLKNVMGYAKGGKADYYSLEKNSGFSSREFNELVHFAKTNDFDLNEFQQYITKRLSEKKSKAGLMMNPAQLLRAITPEPAVTTDAQRALAESLKGPVDAKHNPKYDKAINRLAAGGKIDVYHGSNTGINDSVLESFKSKGALSNIAQGYGQGSGFFVYTEKDKAMRQAKMRVGGSSGFVLAQGDKAGKPMVLTFNEQINPENWDLDYELQKGLITEWLYNNYSKIQDKLMPKTGIAGIRGVVDKDVSKGIMSAGIKTQTDIGSRKTLYSADDTNISEGAIIGQLMSRLKAQDPELVRAFEEDIFAKPLGLTLKYVGETPLKPKNIDILDTEGTDNNTKPEKDFGKIALRQDGRSISATYFKNDKRSGSVSAYKMRDYLYYVGLSEATKGYGPRLYDVVMEAATKDGAMLTSDRSSVSGAAKRVWEYYFKNRGDVKKTPLKPDDWTRNQANIDPKLYGKEDTWPPSTDPAWILQSGYNKQPNLINDPNNVIDMNNIKMDRQAMAANFFAAKTQNFATGGTVPAMVSNGETYIGPTLAKKIGYSKLNKMNYADRNGMSNFAGGGMSLIKGPGSGTSDSIGPVNLPVGSYILREKATKALGLSMGGVAGIKTRKFAVGGDVGSQGRDLQEKRFILESKMAKRETLEKQRNEATDPVEISKITGEMVSVQKEIDQLGQEIFNIEKTFQDLGDDIDILRTSAIDAGKALRDSIAAEFEAVTGKKPSEQKVDEVVARAQKTGGKVMTDKGSMDFTKGIQDLANVQNDLSAKTREREDKFGRAQNQQDLNITSDTFISGQQQKLQAETQKKEELQSRASTATGGEKALLNDQIKTSEARIAALNDSIDGAEQAYIRAKAEIESATKKVADASAAETVAQKEVESAQQALVEALRDRVTNWDSLDDKTKAAAIEQVSTTGQITDKKGNIQKFDNEFKNIQTAQTQVSTAEQAKQTASTSLSQAQAKKESLVPASVEADKAEAEAAKKAAEALSFMRLKAEQNGQTLSQYQQSLKKSILDNAKNIQQAAPGKINQFSQSAFGLTGKIKSGKADDISDAKDILTKQLTDIATGLNPEEISSTVDDLVNSISKGDKSFIDIINSSDALQKIFRDSTSDAGSLSKAMRDLSASTGIPIESLEKLASSADLASSNMYDKNLAAAEKMASNIGKASIAIGLFGSALSKTIKSFGGENNRDSAVIAAAVEGFSSTVSVLGATISQIPSTFDSLKSLTSAGGMLGNTSIGAGINKGLTSAVGLLTNPFVLGGAAVGVAAIGLAAAFKEAHNAAREFDKALAAKNVENAMTRVTQAFDNFSKDLKRLDLLDSIKNELKIAGKNVAQDINIDATVPKAFWMNLLDVAVSQDQGAAAQRSQILEKEGVGAYLSSTSFFNDPASLLNIIGPGGFGLAPAASAVTGSGERADKEAGANRNYYMRKIAPEMAKEQSAQFKPLADATQRLFEEKLRTGTSMQDIMSELKDATGAPTQLAKNIAQANPAIQEQILRIRASNSLDNETKQAMENNIIAAEAEYRARTDLETTLRDMELNKLNREMKKFVVSLDRLFNNMGQSIDKTAFELDVLSRSAELSSASLGGNAKAGETPIKGLNVLKNLDAYAPAERDNAISQASSFFGSQQDIVKPLLGLGNKLEETVLSTINNSIRDNPGKTNEAISTNIRVALDKKLRDLQLPTSIADKLSSQVTKAFSEITKKGVDAEDVSLDDIVEQVPAFAESIASARRAEEEAIKAMEFYQKNINEYANAMNQMVDYQIEANNRTRKATEIQAKGNMELSRALGKRVSLEQVRKVEQAPIKSMTGGLTNAGDIGRQVVNLESIRARQQAASDAAANRGTAGKDEFALMQNRLRGTNVALRENIDALKQMADSTELAQAALQKIQDIQAKRQAGVNLIEKMVTSNPEELAKLNASMARLNNNMSGGLNIGSTSEQRGETLQTFNMLAPLLGDGQKQNELKANVLESMLKESGVGIDSTFQEVINSLRNPEGDPQMAEAISVYRESINKQTEANRVLGELQRLMSANTAEIAAQKLSTAIQGAKLTFENKTLDDIRKGIWILVGKAGGEAPGMQLGGIVYASNGQMIDFKSKGTDTVPAMLTPGEFVVNKKATRSNLPLLQSINNGYQNGGKVGYYAEGGLISPTKEWLKDVGSLNKPFQDRNKENKVIEQPVFPIKDYGAGLNIGAKEKISSFPMSSVGIGSASYLSDWNNDATEVPGNFNRDKITPVLGYGYDQIEVPIGAKGGAGLKITPADPISEITKQRKDYEIPLFLTKETSGIDWNKRAELPADKLGSYNKAIDVILSQFPAASTFENLKKINEQQLEANPPSISPKLGKKGDNFIISGLSSIDNNRQMLMTDAQTNQYTTPDIAALGQIVGFRQDWRTAEMLANFASLGLTTIANPINRAVLGNDNLITRVVSGIEQMRNDSFGIMNNYGSQLRDKSIVYGSSDMNAASQLKTQMTSLISLYELAKEIKTKIKDPKYQESSESIGSKKYLADMEALYNGNVFKATFDKNLLLSRDDVQFPVTLYNMKHDKWVDILKRNNFLKSDGTYMDDSYSNIFSATENASQKTGPVQLVRGDLDAPGGKTNWRDPKNFPWVSSAFSSLPGGSESIFSGAQKEFETGTEIVKLISSEAKAYSSPDNPFAFTYQDVTGKLYDTISRSFVGDDQKYIVVKTQPENNSFPLSELLSNYDNFLYASSIDSLINNLKNNTPIYDTATGKETTSPGTPYKYSLDGENIGLYDYKLNKDFPDAYSGILDENDKHSIIRSSYGKKNINPVNEFFASKYKEQKEKSIEGAMFDKAKQSTEKAAGVRFEKQEPFSTKARTAAAQSVLTAASGANLGVSLPNINKIEDVGGVAAYLNTYLKQLDNKSMEWAKVDAYRGLFKELFKPESDTLGYLKTFAPDIATGQLPPTAIQSIIAREIAANVAQNASGEIKEGDIANLKLDEGKNQFYTVGADGKKTLISPENIEFPQTVADVEKIALTPENLFQDEKKRQSYLDVLTNYFNENKLTDLSDAVLKIKSWYTAQDSLLNSSLDAAKLDANVASLTDNDGPYPATIASKPDYDPSNKLLTGERYGALPDTARMIDLIKVRKKELSQQTTEKKAEGPQRLARGGVVYASNGSLINFQPKGTDTVPAMLTPGEFVINRSSTQKYRPVLEAINNGNYSRGGIINYLNKGGHIAPKYYSNGGEPGSFDFTGYLNSLAAGLTATVSQALDKALSGIKQPNNNSSGVSSNDSGISTIDSFVNRLNNVANILSNVYIPPQITITGKHDVVVTINGDTVLNQLRPDLAGIVVRGIKAAFNDLKAKNPENTTINFNVDINPSQLN